MLLQTGCVYTNNYNSQYQAIRENADVKCWTGEQLTNERDAGQHLA